MSWYNTIMHIINSIINSDMGESLINILLNAKYIGIFFSMILNGVINFPSSQIMYPIVGYYASLEKLNIFIAIAAGALGNAIGNYILFLLSIKYKNYILNKSNKKTQDKVHSLVHKFSKYNKVWLVFGKLVPGVKSFIPVITAMLHINKFLAFGIFLLGSTMWATLMMLLGYYFGETVHVSAYVLVIPFIAFMIISLIIERMITKSLTE